MSLQENNIIINIEKDTIRKDTELEMLNTAAKDQLTPKIKNSKKSFKFNKNEKKVIFYDPINNTYTILKKYTKDEVLDLLRLYEDNFFIIQVDNDDLLHEEIIKIQFKAEFKNIHKMFNIKLDYCFSPVDELLCFNLSLLTNIFFDEIEKFLIQILFHKNGLYIINKDSCENILNIFVNEFHFSKIDKEEFFKKLTLTINSATNNINNKNIDINNNNNIILTKFNNEDILTEEKPRRNSSKSKKINRNKTFDGSEYEISENKIYPRIFNDDEVIISQESNSDISPTKKKSTFHKDHIILNKNINILNNVSANNNKISNAKTFNKQRTSLQIYNHNNNNNNLLITLSSKGKGFYEKIQKVCDDLIYWLLILSLEKLEEFSELLVREAESLKGIYLELSEHERKDFFRRIHSVEVAKQIINQEIITKKKFLKYAKAQFRVYHKLSQKFYFNNNFQFLFELMIAKVTQLEIVFEKLENILRMIKENYSIIIEDNTEKQNVRLNTIMKVLAIMTTIYAPFNIIPGFFGMNVLVPWKDAESLWPFFGIILFCCLLMFLQLLFFKKLKWF
jgi:hypothetical protein